MWTVRRCVSATNFIAGLVFLTVIADHGLAANFDWTTASDGDFDNSGNWTATDGGTPPPAAADIVNFNEVGTYVVTFNQDEASGDLRVLGGTVTFASDSTTLRTYSINSGAFDANVSGGGLQVGSPNKPVFLNLGSAIAGSVLNVGSTAGDGILLVTGSGSRVDALGTGSHNVGRNGSTGTLLLESSSTVNYGGTLNLGVNAGSDGQVSVTGGSTLTANHIAIATDTTDAIGAFTVTGSGSTVDQSTPGANLSVGSASGGTGMLVIESGGAFTTGTGVTTVNATGTIDVQDGLFNANGNVIVDDGLLQIQASGDLSLGNGVLLTIQNGGEVIFTGSQTIDAANTVTVSGTSSGLRANGGLTITGGSTVDLNSGGFISNTFTGSDLTVGNATLMIGGAGAPVNLRGAAGAAGSPNGGNGSAGGSFFVQGNGQVDLAVESTLRLEGGAGGIGEHNVGANGGDGGHGANAGALNIEGGSVTLNGPLDAHGGDGGRGGSGTATGGVGGRGGDGGPLIVSGGVLALNGAINAQGGEGGRAFDSPFEPTGDGGSGGDLLVSGGIITFDGSLNLQGGSGGFHPSPSRAGDGGEGGSVLITAGQLSLQGGMIDLTGGTAGSGIVSDGADGSLDLMGGTLSVDATGANALESILVVGQFNFLTGTLHLTDASGFTAGSVGLISGLIGGSDVSLTANQTLSVEKNLTFPTGTSLTLNGGSVSAATTIFNSGVSVSNPSGSGAIGGAVLALAGSTIDVAGGDLTIGDITAVNGFGSAGTMHVGGNTVSLLDANDSVFDSLALVTLGDTGSPGTLDAANGLTLDFGGNVTGYGTIATPDNAATPVINNGNIIGNSFPGEPISLTGYVKGVGTCDNCNITGTDAPGFSTAAVNRGSVSYNGTLEIELGGTSPGSGFDQLNHILGAGIADLGGTLDVSLIGGFTPTAGDTFEIITATSVLDMFDTVNLPPLPSDLLWFVNYSATSVQLVSTFGADFDEDGDVDYQDLMAWESGYGGTPATHMTGDADFSATADGFDFLAWQRQFDGGDGAPLAASTRVPEPSSLLLAAFGILAISMRHTQGYSIRIVQTKSP